MSILLVLSVMANIAMFLMLIGVIAVFATGQRSMLAEDVVREGPSRNRIAMVTVQGIIHGELANDVYRQLKAAREDRRVRGIIVRINSPGGTISASDQIYKEIRKYREEVKKPVVAFMQGVAASGGYYASVACDKIVAEPTTVTGSIGVISWWLVVQELLEDKLGVLPVTITSGQKKDWPSSFREPSPEELQYMRDKLITPAYERFVEIVAEGRKELLSPEAVRQLSDGSIFGAQEALEVKLIDEIGYLDRAIGMVKSMAGIDEAEVVEYRKPLSLMDFLSYRKASLPKLDRNLLYELGTPEILYLWSAY
ncbi:MAG: signal peptide peptidase SppA [Planctomycetota bacterium]